MGATPALVIREYEPADHKTLVELNRYALAAAAGVPDDTHIYGGDLDDIAGTYVIGRGAMLVGDIQGAAVAMSGLREIDTSRCKILRTRVNPNYQGRGSPALSSARWKTVPFRSDTQTAVLLTGPHQHPALDLCRSAGYEQLEIERIGELIGVRLVKSLSTAISS